MAKLKVLICGGGIAGNALAFWLSRMGHDITLIERFSSLRSTGLQLDLRGHGIEVLKLMNLEQAFRANSVQEQGFEMVDKSDRVRAFFPANRTGKGAQSFTSDFEIMRGDFVRLLYDATKEAKYLFGTTIKSFEQHDSFIEVLFSDGKKDRFDLLVGADGQGSYTRKMMIGPDTPDPIHFLDRCAAYFTTPREMKPGETFNATIYIAPGWRFLLTRRHSPHQVQIYLSCQETARLKAARKGNIEEEKEAFAEIFRGAGWHTDEILKSLEQADDFYCEHPGVVKLDSWSSGRVVLVGDAAYCPTMNSGMGTTASIVGAYILAGEIGQHCGGSSATEDELDTALKAYEEKFRPFMDQVQHGIVEQSFDWVIPSTAWGIAIFNFIIGLVSFFRLDFIGRLIMREKVRDWTLPDYHEMVNGKS